MNGEVLDRLTEYDVEITADEVRKVTRFGEEGAKLVTRLANQDGQTFSQAVKAVQNAYDAGFTDLKATQVNFENDLQKAAFDAGKVDRGIQDRAAVERSVHATARQGVFTENEFTKDFKESDRKMISTFANSLKMDVTVVDKIIASVVNNNPVEANAQHQDGDMQISNNTTKILYEMVMHEGGHRMRQLAPNEFGVLMNALYERAARRSVKLGVPHSLNLDSIKAEHDNAGIIMDTSGYLEEFAVRELETIFSSAEEFNKWYDEISGNQQVKTAWEKFVDWIHKVVDDIKRALSQTKMTKAERAEAKRAVAELERIKELFGKTWKAAETAANERATEQAGLGKDANVDVKSESFSSTHSITNKINYDIRKEFYAEFEEWVADGKKDTNKRFVIGNTSEALQSIGVKNQEVLLSSGTVVQKLNNHKEMTTDIFKRIPELLEHPIIVQFSDAIDPKNNKPKYESRITVLGELYAEVYEKGKRQQKPVLVSLELLPTNQKKTVVLDFSIITSAYAKDTLQNYLYENSILYIEPNKKRTDKWLSLNRLQLPLGETKYGPIRSITYVHGKVKIKNSTKKTAMQIALEKAGAVDEYGNERFFLKKENSSNFLEKKVETEYNKNTSDLLRDGVGENKNGGFIGSTSGNGKGLDRIRNLAKGDSIYDVSASGEGANYRSGNNEQSNNGGIVENASYSLKDSEAERYTEHAYRQFGWARANNILNEGQNADYRSKFADAKLGRAKFPKSKLGEYIIPVSDIYDSNAEGINNVLVFAKGTIASPVITSVIEIYEYDETSLDRVRRQIYDSERRGIQQKAGELFGRYYASDFEFRPNQQRAGAESVRNSGHNGRRKGSGGETSPVKGETKVSHALKETAYGENKSYSLKDGEAERYTEHAYRQFGWARANNILNEGQNADYRSKFANAKLGRAKFPKSKLGEYIIPVSDIYDSNAEGINNVLVFAKGTIANPVITSVIEIYEYDETNLDRVRRQIYDSERRGVQQKAGELFGRYYASDFEFQPNQQRAGAESVRNSGHNGHRKGSGGETSSVEGETKVSHALKETAYGENKSYSLKDSEAERESALSENRVEEKDAKAEDVQYSISRVQSNGVRVYESDFPEGVSMEERVKIFKDRIATIFNLGAVSLKTDTKRIVVRGDKFTEQKNIFGDDIIREDEFDAKISALYDMADILETSHYVPRGKENEMEESYRDKSIEPKNKAHKGVKYWYKFENNIILDGVPYKVIFNIRDKGKEQYQYLIEFRNQNKPHSVSNTVENNLLRTNHYATYKDSIRQNGEKSNTFSKNTQYSISKAPSTEQMPKKAQEAIRRQEGQMVREMGAALSIPMAERRDFLKEAVQKLAHEAFENGDIPQKMRETVFEEAYKKGVIEDGNFYNQYKEIKKQLRSRAVYVSDKVKADIADYNDFRKHANFILRIVKEGGGTLAIILQYEFR